MCDKNYFIGNPNGCAQARLKQGGIPLTETVSFKGEDYHGAWVSQKCARKVWESCVRQEGCGDVPPFDLFAQQGRKGVIKISTPRSIQTTLGATMPKKIPTELSGNHTQEFSQQAAAA